MKRPHNIHVGGLLRLYTQQVLALHDFEKHLSMLLRQIARTSISEELRSLLEQHLRKTQAHIPRLEQILKRLGVTPEENHHRETSRLITELRHQLRSSPRAYDLRHEAALLTTLHKVEAFEVASYASTHSYARLLSFHDDLAPLEETYAEEKAMEERIEQLMGQLKEHSRHPELHLVS